MVALTLSHPCSYCEAHWNTGQGPRLAGAVASSSSRGAPLEGGAPYMMDCVTVAGLWSSNGTRPKCSILWTAPHHRVPSPACTEDVPTDCFISTATGTGTNIAGQYLNFG